MDSFLKIFIALVLVEQGYTNSPTVMCPLHEKYNGCGTSCPLTCSNYNNPPRACNRMCNPGCQCDEGYVRDADSGRCCLPAECPAAQKQPEICTANEVYDECGSACPLTCDNYKNPPQICTDNCVIGCRCKEGYVEKADGDCCLPKDCPAAQVCTANEVYDECGSACPLTCDNYKNPPEICTMNCVIGCRCKEGYVEKADGDCCLPKDCPASEPELPSTLDEVNDA